MYTYLEGQLEELLRIGGVGGLVGGDAGEARVRILGHGADGLERGGRGQRRRGGDRGRDIGAGFAPVDDGSHDGRDDHHREDGDGHPEDDEAATGLLPEGPLLGLVDLAVPLEGLDCVH